MQATPAPIQPLPKPCISASRRHPAAAALHTDAGIGKMVFRVTTTNGPVARTSQDRKMDNGSLEETRACASPEVDPPSVSFVVPVHNEEKTLAATLQVLSRLTYAGPRPQIVVALNGCTDQSAQTASRFDVTVTESDRAGMSFGKNLGADAATGEVLVFIDADTTLPPHGLQVLIDRMRPIDRPIATVAGWPDRGGLFVQTCFRFANRYAKRKGLQAPGGVIGIRRDDFAALGGFDESLPQGTSSDLFMRAADAGMQVVHVDKIRATTSTRRFEKTGVLRQMLQWRRNHRQMAAGRHDAVAQKAYEAIR
jgi:hypothetical protein